MQSFGAFFNDNKVLTICLAVLAAIVACAVLIVLYRLLFGPRLHMSNGGGRARQPRLGVVDAFDLDRQRQLVLVRRDNVEHLIMIGGPNDIVIESAFIRTPVNLPLPVGRDKDGPQVQVAPMAPMPSLAGGMGPAVSAAGGSADAPPAPLPATAPASEPDRTPSLPMAAERTVAPRDLGPLAEIPAPAPVAMPTGPEAPPAGARTDTDRPAPLRPMPLPRPPGGLPPRPLTPPAAGAVPRPPTPLRPPVQASAMPPRPTPIGPRPATSSLTRGTSASAFRREPPAAPAAAASDTPAGPEGSASAAAAAEAPPQEAAPAPAKPSETGPGDSPKKNGIALPAPLAPPTASAIAPTGGPIPTTLDTLESLEEEMAKLLGRPVTAPDKG